MNMDYFLNIGFLLFHATFIGFILFAWLSPRWRPAHLIAAGLTLISWFVLGAGYAVHMGAHFWEGFGFCVCTQWHWTVRERLGDTDLPDSFIKFAIDRGLGCDVNPCWTDVITVGLFVLVMIASGTLWSRDRRKKAAVRRLPHDNAC